MATGTAKLLIIGYHRIREGNIVDRIFCHAVKLGHLAPFSGGIVERKIHRIGSKRVTNHAVSKMHVRNARIISGIAHIRELTRINDGDRILGGAHKGGGRDIVPHEFIQNARGGIRHSVVFQRKALFSSRARGNEKAPLRVIVHDAFSRRRPFQLAKLPCACDRVFHALGARRVKDEFFIHFLSPFEKGCFSLFIIS